MILLIKQVKIIDPKSKHHLKVRDVLIENDSITSIKEIIESVKDATIIPGDNLLLSNGWFDSSVCVGEPGYEDRETIDNTLKTAAKSGFTAIAVNSNNDPAMDNRTAVKYLLNQSMHQTTSVFPIGNLTKGGYGKDMAEMYDMKEAGAIAFGDYKKSISND